MMMVMAMMMAMMMVGINDDLLFAFAAAAVALAAFAAADREFVHIERQQYWLMDGQRHGAAKRAARSRRWGSPFVAFHFPASSFEIVEKSSKRCSK